ncbi:hypothetical protein KRM28CT15_05320 [Krasilnikovia sp. M28-CT-15]
MVTGFSLHSHRGIPGPAGRDGGSRLSTRDARARDRRLRMVIGPRPKAPAEPDTRARRYPPAGPAMPYCVKSSGTVRQVEHASTLPISAKNAASSAVDAVRNPSEYWYDPWW